MQESTNTAILSNNPKPVILVFIGNYLPGYKAGGILRSVINTVDHLSNEFDFRIVTRDRDLGDTISYADIKHDQWQQVGNAMVYYLPPSSIRLKSISTLIESVSCSVYHLNSFFDPLTIMVLLNRKLGRIKSKPVILSPRGEFAWASLKQKYPKKIIFINIARLLGLYKGITWHVSSEYERIDLVKIMKIKPDRIHIALDLPKKIISGEFFNHGFNSSTKQYNLKLVFLSRISREKNLDYALRVLAKVNANLSFDIYGPAENALYWKECQELINQLPTNIKVNYKGSLNPNQVINALSCYDLLFFPTAGENYGHVIAESLISGTPVLISNKTPWRNLEADEFGWDLDLSQMNSFVEKIEKFHLFSYCDRLKQRALIKLRINNRLIDPVAIENNRQLFKKHIVTKQVYS